MNQTVLDWLFRLSLYRGIRVDPPKNLISVDKVKDTNLTETFSLLIDDQSEIGDWLLNECEGPWSIGMKRPFKRRQPYVCFARAADAVIFRIKQS